MSSNSVNHHNQESSNSHNAPDIGKSDAESYVKLLKEGQRRLQLTKWFTAFCIAFGLMFVLFGSYVLLEHSIYFSSGVKAFAVLAVLLSSSIIPYIWMAKISKTPFRNFYTEFSDRYHLPELKYLIDFSIYERFSRSAFYEAARKQNFDALDKEEVSKKLESYKKTHPISKLFRYSLIGVGVAILFLGSTVYTLPNSTSRALAFWQTYKKPNPYQYTVQPGNETAEQGKVFKPSITFTGNNLPDEVTLAVKTEVEADFRKLKMDQISDSVYLGSASNLSNNLEYYVAMDEFKSPTYTMNVQLRPRFKNLQVSIIPPSYTGLEKSVHNYPFSTIQAYNGSKLFIKGTVNKTLERLFLTKLATNDTTNITPDGQQDFSAQLNVTRNDTISFAMRDLAGLENKNQFAFTIDQLQDESPYVSINKPAGELAMANPDSISIEYQASDDFGLHSATLLFNIARAYADAPIQKQISLGTPKINQNETFTWNLTHYSFKPRDQITYWIKVRDNDELNNYKPAVSQKLVIRVPSLTEGLDEIEEKETETQNALEEISDSYDDIQKKYEDFKNKLKEGDSDTWQQNRELEEIKKERSELEKKVEQLQGKFEQLRKDMQQENSMSDETMEAYNELEKLMKEIDDPEIMEMLEKMQESLSDLNQNELRKAMEELEFNEEAYQQRLKRTVELFKKLKLNSDLEKMARAMDNLSEQEKELSETEDDPATEAKKQEAIKKDLESVEKILEKIDENSSDDNQKDIDELKHKNSEDLQKLKDKLQENIEELKKQKQKQKAEKGQNKAEGNKKLDNQNVPPSSTSNNGQQQEGDNNKSDESDEDRKADREQGDKNNDMQEQDTGEKIQQQQQQIQQQMQQMAQNMRSSKQSMAQQQQQLNIAALESILQSLLNQSYMQESLTKDTEELAERSKAFVEKARIQKNISDQFRQSSDSLTEVAAKIPMLSNRITDKKLEIERNLENAVEQLAERNRSKSTVAERQSLGGINELSSMIASLLDQLNNQSGQGGKGSGMSAQQMMQQMQQMGQQQQQLNQQIQQMINDMQGQRLSQDNMKRLEQMSKQQNQIRKQLEQMSRSGALEPGDKMLSELERMAKEMEKSINDMRGGSLDQPFVKRQQNILSRMLEAEKAMQERGKSKKEREAKTPDDTPSTISPDVTIEELRKMIQKRLQDPEQTSFSEDYQELIETYFELLQQREKINS